MLNGFEGGNFGVKKLSDSSVTITILDEGVGVAVADAVIEAVWVDVAVNEDDWDDDAVGDGDAESE